MTVLVNQGYLVGYSEKHRNPAWVAYHLRRVDNPPTLPRPNRFLVDDRTVAKVRSEDYTRSGYDRGHMAPNWVIATRYGVDAQLETFLMSNICPQRPGLNRGPWQKLEMLEAKDYANRFEEVWVIVGPLYGPPPTGRLQSGVDIPEAFFRIILDEVNGRPRMIAWVLPQNPAGQALDEYLRSVDDVEAMSGFDFLSELDDELESRLEAEVPIAGW